MKYFVIFLVALISLLFTGCQKERAKPSPTPTPKKKAEFKREVFDVEKYPGLTAIGKLEISSAWCALTLVAEDIAVTAGHCFAGKNFNLLDKKKDLRNYTNVVFKTKDGVRIPNVKVEKALRWKIDPDFAIVKLNKKIPKNQIKPLKLSDMPYAKMLQNTEKLGCAGYNGDKELGDRGKNLTISRNIKIYYETSNSKRIDTNCVSTFGGSGGLFFEEKYNAETETNEYYFIGVIWGVRGDNFDRKGELVNDRDVVTSITPIKVFRKELKEIID